MQRKRKRNWSTGRFPARRRSSGHVRTISPPEGLRPTDAELPLAEAGDLHDELQRTRDELRDLRQLHEVILYLQSVEDMAALRDEALNLALNLSRLKRGILALRAPSDEGGSPRFKIHDIRNFDEDGADRAEEKILRGILNRSLEQGETLLEGDILQDGILEFATDSKRLHLGAVACLPLEADGRAHPLGAFILDDPDRRDPFSHQETTLLRDFTRHLGQALHRLAETHRLQRRLNRSSRQAERLEAERDLVVEKYRKLEKRLQEDQGAQHARTGKLTRALNLPYLDAKKRLLREYLLEVLDHAGGDPRVACRWTRLNPEDLRDILEKHGLELPTGRGRPSDWGKSAR